MATKEQAKTITQEQFDALKQKLNSNKPLTAQEWQDFAVFGTQQAEQEQKTEALVADIIADLKKANIAPAKLTTILEGHGLIVLPKVAQPEEKVFLSEEAITTAAGRNSKFKIWMGRDVSKLTGDALKYWTDYKAKGKDYFLSTLTTEGRSSTNKTKLRKTTLMVCLLKQPSKEEAPQNEGLFIG